MERDDFGKKAYKPRKYFNSHAHVERDLYALKSILTAIISTHTLTWSVTYAMCYNIITVRDFNSHAHVERDWFGGIDYVLCKNFNSHAHVERDAFLTSCIRQPLTFQLTRSRGAWLLYTIYCMLIFYFNSHAHVERDNSRKYHSCHLIDFNSHAHVERDTKKQKPFTDHKYFNSHAHVERDDSLTENLPALVISTHTLTWSVTQCVPCFAQIHKFQLTRSRGAWRKGVQHGNARVDFNSHAHVERDYIWYAYTPLKFDFNSHAHVERDTIN